MKLLLINQNPVVSRMMKISVPKAGFDIEECESVYELPRGEYDVVVIDDDMYDENFFKAIKENISYKKLGLLTSSKESELEAFDFLIPKPFLPTDLVEILREVKANIEQEKDIYKDEIAYMEQESEEKHPKITQEEFLQEEIEEKESIVEIEESQEESPFIEEPLVKSGILDEEEIESVSKLLEEETKNEEKIKKRDKKLFQEPIDSIQKKESTQGFFKENEESLEKAQEKSQEELLQKEEEEEKLETSTKEEDENLSQEKEIQKISTNVDIASLKELLNGMKIDISITISFPDKKNV